MTIHNIWENEKCSKQPTSYHLDGITTAFPYQNQGRRSRLVSSIRLIGVGRVGEHFHVFLETLRRSKAFMWIKMDQYGLIWVYMDLDGLYHMWIENDIWIKMGSCGL